MNMYIADVVQFVRMNPFQFNIFSNIRDLKYEMTMISWLKGGHVKMYIYMYTRKLIDLQYHSVQVLIVRCTILLTIHSVKIGDIHCTFFHEHLICKQYLYCKYTNESQLYMQQYKTHTNMGVILINFHQCKYYCIRQ